MSEHYILMVAGKEPGTKVHDNEVVAIQEAERLCMKESKAVWVFKAVARVYPPTIRPKVERL